MYTISVPADRAWLSDPTNPATLVAGGTVDAGTTFQLDGEVRVFAGNIVEGVARQQDLTIRQITMRHLSATQRAQVVAWRGTPVLLRTTEGDRFFGFYLAVAQRRLLRTTPEDGTADTTTYDLDLAFTRISYDETQLP